jgi:pterin-4a-carbinolamine dehydratase
MSKLKVSSLLREYFEHQPVVGAMRDFSIDTRSLPVSPATTSKWVVKERPERLCRTFEFSNRESCRHFINELMDYEDRSKHHAEIKCRGNIMTIEIYTQDIDTVTELDKDYAKEVDAIYDEMRAYGYT